MEPVSGDRIHDSTVAWARRRTLRPHVVLDRIALQLSTSKTIDGLWIGVWEDKPEQYLQRVEAALLLIKTCDPIRYQRLIRDLKRVWVFLLPASIGSFKEPLQTCQLDPRFVLSKRATPDIIAAVIVHEATHARLRRCGFSYREEVRPRVEAICIRQELAFARRLQDGARVREWAEASLTACATPDALTDVAREKRHVEGSLEVLRHLGAPNWVLRLTRANLKVKAGIRQLIRLLNRRS